MPNSSRRVAVLSRHFCGGSSPKPADDDNLDWRISTRGLTVEVSNRHIHLSQAAVEQLFGEGYELTPVKGLAGIPLEFSRYTGFASSDTLDVVNPVNGKVIKGLRILGPARDEVQVELAFTDCRSIGLEAPVRISGDTAGSAAVVLVNPKTGAKLELPEGGIRAWRHLHVDQTQAAWLGIKHGDLMAVKVTSPMCSVTLNDCLVRVFGEFPEQLIDVLVRKGIKLPCNIHVDTDEGNAAMLQDAEAFELFRQNPDGSLVSLIKTGSGGDTKSEWAQMAAAKARKRREMLAREKEPRPGGVHYDAVIRRTAQSRR